LYVVVFFTPEVTITHKRCEYPLIQRNKKWTKQQKSKWEGIYHFETKIQKWVSLPRLLWFALTSFQHYLSLETLTIVAKSHQRQRVNESQMSWSGSKKCYLEKNFVSTVNSSLCQSVVLKEIWKKSETKIRTWNIEST
jgi:hypothetical protein